jgi:hypothetical protein
MARIDWVKAKLENWGRWSMQSESGALGYPSQSPFYRFSAPVGAAAGASVPVQSLDASEVDRAVSSFRLTRSHLYLVLTLTYAKGLPRHQVAMKMGRAESTISANLCEADRAVAAWFEEKRQAQHAKQALK